MCDQRWMLENFVAIIPGSWEVSGIGDSKVQALGHGDVPIDVQKGDETRPGTIRNVLYVPGLGINLLSVGSVTDQGRSVIFKEIEFTVNRENDVLMTRSRVGISLYRLNISPRAPSAQKMALAAASTVSNASLVLWHKRLAHINYKSIIRMAGKDAVRGLQLPKELWAEAANCAAYTLNRILTATRDRTPHEVWHGRKPDLSGMRIFGSRSFAQIPDQNRKKLDPKARECILVGYPTTQKGYRLWDPVARRILISRDVRRKPKLHHTTGTAD